MLSYNNGSLAKDAKVKSVNSFHGYNGLRILQQRFVVVNMKMEIRSQLPCFAAVSANWPCEFPNTDLVSRWGPGSCGNSHLCILADWPLVTQS